MSRAITACDQCGQHDDHPKLHYGLSTWHHDCAPSTVRSEVIDGSVNPDVVAAIFEHATSGVRGPDLLAKITELTGEQNG